MSSSRRVLVVSRSTVAHPGSGGMEAVAHTIISNLSGDAFEFALLTTPGCDPSLLDGVFTKVWTVDNAKSARYSLKWWLRSAAPKSAWHSWSPDVIFSISRAAGSFTLHPAWDSTRKISQCHGTALKDIITAAYSPSFKNLAKSPLNIGRMIWERTVYRRFTAVASIGPSVSTHLNAGFYSINPSQIVTIPNAVDLDYWGYSDLKRKKARQQLGLCNEVPLAVFTGRLHRQKGADLAINALARLPRSDWHMLLCGEGPEFDRLQRLGVELGVSDRLHFSGKVDSARLSEYLSGADLFIFPTRVREGLPMSALEALAAGLPVLTAPTSNLPSDLRSNVVYSRLDPGSLASAWMSMSFRKDRSCQLPDKYSLPIMLDNYRALLQGDL